MDKETILAIAMVAEEFRYYRDDDVIDSQITNAFLEFAKSLEELAK